MHHTNQPIKLRITSIFYVKIKGIPFNGGFNMFYQAKSICLYCDHHFTTTKVRSSKAKVIQRDSDFCVHYEGPNSLFYDITICPGCGFAFYNSYRKLNQHQRQKLNNMYISKINVPDMTGERSIEEAIHTFKLALLTAGIVNERKFITANLALKLAWLYRFTEDDEQELRFLKLALEDYIYMLQNEDITQEDVDEDRLIYLMADLNTRLNQYEAARKLFSQLITGKNVSPRYKSMAIDRWQDYKEEFERTNT